MNTAFSGLDLDLSFQPIINDEPHCFTATEIEHYNREGYIAGIRLYEGECLRNLQGFFDGARESLTDYNPFRSFHHTSPELYDVVTDQHLVGHLQDLLGSNVVCFVSQYSYKKPGEERSIPWHQDAAYNPIDARSVIVWLAIDDATVENGCMHFIPGSHRRGLVNFNMQGGNATSTGAREINETKFLGESVPIELPAGEAVFFSDLLIHSSPGNFSSRPRGGFTMTFASADLEMKKHPQFNVTNQESVLCCGQDTRRNWINHSRPTVS